MSKYNIIYADPPWRFNNRNTGGSMKSGADNHYPTMSVDEICAMPVPEICADDCALVMWWVAAQPIEALKVVEAWGFTIKTMTGFMWVKLTSNYNMQFGMGHYTRQGSESALIAVRGKPERVSGSVRAVAAARVQEHSRKPDLFRGRIVQLLGDKPRIELFARRRVEGWDAHGNEIEDGIIL